jgi:hypothetical protein
MDPSSQLLLLRLQTPGHLSTRPKIVDGKLLTRPRQCEYCDRETVYYCPVCGVFLCATAIPPARMSCTEIFHKRPKLPTARIQRPKRTYKRRREEQAEEESEGAESGGVMEGTERGEGDHQRRGRRRKRRAITEGNRSEEESSDCHSQGSSALTTTGRSV